MMFGDELEGCDSKQQSKEPFGTHRTRFWRLQTHSTPQWYSCSVPLCLRTASYAQVKIVSLLQNQANSDKVQYSRSSFLCKYETLKVNSATMTHSLQIKTTGSLSFVVLSFCLRRTSSSHEVTLVIVVLEAAAPAASRKSLGSSTAAVWI